MHPPQQQPLLPSITRQRERTSFWSLAIDPSYVRVFEDLVNQQILLLPFTVDHLGGIGTLGHRLLFGHDPHKAPQPTTTKPSNRHSLLLYSTTLHTVHSPLLTSYAVPTKTGPDPSLTPASAPPTTPASLPNHWAQQLLGLKQPHHHPSQPLPQTHPRPPYNPATHAPNLPHPAHNTPLAAAPSTPPHTQVAYALCVCTMTCNLAVYYLRPSVMKFQARNLPDRIFCGTYAEVSNLRHAVP
jgi:hypothetical protein